MGTILNKLVGKSYLERQFRRFHKLFMRDQILDPLREAVDNKVDIVEGYGLSKNDLTDALKTKLDNLENYDDTELKNQNRSNRRSLNRLNSDINTVGSVSNTVEDRVQEVINNAPSDFDTVKEISDWIDEHDGDASDMLVSVTQNTSDLTNLKNRWDNYEVLVNEDSNIDFTHDSIFYVAEWIHVVPNSLTFTGNGILTDDPEDYTVDLVQSKITSDGTIYSSEPLTVCLDDLELLDFKVSVEYDRSTKCVKVSIIGICAGSTEYTIGNLETVRFELHQWLHVSIDSTLDITNLVINENTGSRDYSNCEVSKVVLTIENDAKGHVTHLTEDTYTLNELVSLGLDVNVQVGGGVHNGNYSVESDINISGRSVCSSDAFVDSIQTKTFVEFDYAYYTATESDLGGVRRANAIKWSEQQL